MVITVEFSLLHSISKLSLLHSISKLSQAHTLSQTLSDQVFSLELCLTSSLSRALSSPSSLSQTLSSSLSQGRRSLKFKLSKLRPSQAHSLKLRPSLTVPIPLQLAQTVPVPLQLSLLIDTAVLVIDSTRFLSSFLQALSAQVHSSHFLRWQKRLGLLKKLGIFSNSTPKREEKEIERHQ
ncbi:hypothetical protein IGI04_037435 [Brassica rapa subsp. trilocularis]|uniref:Uncharacterized protein n=1 Tax=Brassica rapa subsp. trilocularis TaxID=1813537 RepID=A0ABQ7LHB4_BRACM|nr:hypothetical protein IGI04_037435 [Brassica rapa subsp. trilocularis]